MTLRAGKVFLILIVAAIVAGVTPLIASAGGGGAEKFDLLGPNGIAYCDGSGVVSGVAGDFGSAIINAPGDNTVEATVQISKQTPNTLYNIRLVQGNSDCKTIDATVTTNGQGNATVQLSEPSTSLTALIAVDGDGAHFVTQTYAQS